MEYIQLPPIMVSPPLMASPQVAEISTAASSRVPEPKAPPPPPVVRLTDGPGGDGVTVVELEEDPTPELEASAAEAGRSRKKHNKIGESSEGSQACMENDPFEARAPKAKLHWLDEPRKDVRK